MRIEGVDGGPERRICIGLCTNGPFLSRVAAPWGRDPLRSRWANLVASWCLDYYEKFKGAPGRALRGYFESWERGVGDEDTARLVNLFLGSLSEEYDRTDPDPLPWLVEQAETHLNEVRLERLKEALDKTLRAGDTKSAVTIAEEFRPLSLTTTRGMDLLRDSAARREALSRRENVLIRYPGAAGTFFGDELAENSFVVYMAPIKVGKSWLQLDAAWNAMQQNRRVAYFQIGDLDLTQIITRFAVRAMRRPAKRALINYPERLEVGADFVAKVEKRPMAYERDATLDEMDSAFERLTKGEARSLEVKYYPSGTVTIAGIRNDLEQWDREGWKADVVVVDYLENLAPVDPKKEAIHATDDTWRRAKQITEVRNCLLVSGHQCNAAGYKARVLTRSNFRGSLMTLAHASAVVGINQTDEEKNEGLVRLNWMARRKDFFSESRCLVAAGCLGLAQPIIKSWF